MAKSRILVDTDVIIDALRGVKAARQLLRSQNIGVCCSVLTKKELLAKPGLSGQERKRVLSLLSEIKIYKLDRDITRKYSLLVEEYGDNPESLADYVIAATAWSKKLPLLTRNRKHFELINEIELAPVYQPT